MSVCQINQYLQASRKGAEENVSQKFKKKRKKKRKKKKNIFYNLRHVRTNRVTRDEKLSSVDAEITSRGNVFTKLI